MDAVLNLGQVVEETFLERTTVFDALLIDPRTFLHLREGQEEREELAARLRQLGFSDRRDFSSVRLTSFHKIDTPAPSHLSRRPDDPPQDSAGSGGVRLGRETKMIKAFMYSSCGPHDVSRVLIPLGFFARFIQYLGFYTTPYALSSGAAVQFHDFCVGERQISDSIQMLAYSIKHQPPSTTRHLLNAAEMGVVQMNTPVEPLIGNDIVNFNRVADFIATPLREAGADNKLVSGWAHALFNCRDDLRERADALLAAWPEGVADSEEAREAVAALWSRRLEVDDMVRDLEELRERLRKPMALQIHNTKFLPDGRSVSWPPGFKAQQIEVGRRLNVPTLDFAPVIAQLGTARTLEKDLAYPLVTTFGLQAELMYDFFADILGRPHLEDYPEWREARPSLYLDLPDLLAAPARLTFPDVATFRGS